MGRGYLFGVLFGTLAAVVSLAVISLMGPPVQGPVTAQAPEATDGTTVVAEAAPAAEVAETAEAAVPAEPADSPGLSKGIASEDQAEADATPPEEVAAEEADVAAEPAPAEVVEVPGTLSEQTETAAATPDTPVVEIPGGSEFSRPMPETDPVVPTAVATPAEVARPVVVAPEIEPAPDLVDVSPAEIPEGQSISPGKLAAPELSGEERVANALAAEASAPAWSSGDIPAPVLGESAAPERQPVASTPAEAPKPARIAPSETPQVTAEAPAEPVTEQVVPEAERNIAAAESVEEPTTEPVLSASKDEGGQAGEPTPATEIAEAVPSDDADHIAVVDPAVPETGQAVAPEVEPALPETDAGTEGAEAESAPRIIDFAPTERIGVATAPQPGFSRVETGVKINRLPRIGVVQPEEPDPAVETADSATFGDGTALGRFAARFDNPEDKPIISLILIDDGSAGGPDPDALAALGSPVTIAIDPQAGDASARAAAYRLAGHEVAIMAPELPERANASDLEVSYQGFVSALPEAVALIGASDAAYQSDRRVAQHLVALLGAEGRGLVTYDRGLNPARQTAIGAGLAHAGVYRVLDGEGESALTIRRYLDRAGFEAARTGQVVVAAHAVPETLNAIGDWIATGAKGTVIAPVSASMQQAGG